jgi:hypothetical protein
VKITQLDFHSYGREYREFPNQPNGADVGKQQNQDSDGGEDEERGLDPTEQKQEPIGSRRDQQTNPKHVQ